MAIKINFDAVGNPEPPILVLATRSGNKFGQLPAESINVADYQNEPSEIQFQLHKYDSNGDMTYLWDEMLNFRLVWCRNWDVWFQATVSLDEDTETVKTVSCTRLGQAELSQIMLYDIEINTEDDIARDDYEIPTVLYSTAYPEASLLDRIMEKAPHYSVIHVDDTIANIQRTFSFDGTSLYDAFQEIAEEIGCLFVFHSDSDDDGNPNRTISVYDLESNCVECGYRGEFTSTCPECGGTTINEGYGEDTTIFVTADALGSDIQFTTDTDSVKNCFRLVGGDDLMTATIRNCNPNGTSYIWYLTDDMKADMSDELVTRLDEYDALYEYYKNEYVADLSSTLVTQYNELVEKYKTYNSELETLDEEIVGYSALMNAYYNTIDLAIYLQSTFMPDVTTSESDASSQAALLTADNLSPVAVSNIKSLSTATASSSVLAMAKAVVSSKFQVKVNDGATLSDGVWTGSFTVTNYSDDEDTATSSTVSVTISDDYEEYLLQLIKKELSGDDTDDVSITGLFAYDITMFTEELKLYCLDSLTSFHDSCQACLDILIEQGIGSEDTWAGEDPNLYEDLYAPYYEKLQAIEEEMALREDEIELITGVYDSDGNLETDGMQTVIEAERDAIQAALDFEAYVGEGLWLEFCAFRREDEYTNSNYISDGLNNAELFQLALEFIEVAKGEIYKSAELQHSISATLKNLLVIDKFETLVDYFEIGNWLRVRIDDEVYKLRLVSYEIDYDNLEELSVEFSDVMKTATGISDIESIINQASAMATSYSATQRQAGQGASGSKVVANWRSNGLDVTNTKIISGADNQSQTWDSHGMLFRKYDPLTDSYEAEQSKIVNSTYAITDDNWRTIRTAIGKFYYVNPTTGELTSAYGINGEVLIGNLILGESLGIYTADGSLTFDSSGLTIDTSSGTALTIMNNGNKQFYIDSDGNVVLNNGASLVWGNIDLTDLILSSDNVVTYDEEGNTIEFLTYLQLEYLNAEYITSQCIDTQYLNADVIDAYLANIVNLNAENLSTSYLSAAIADIAKANITDLVAENITADYIAALLLEASEANIASLSSLVVTSEYVSTALLAADSASISELQAIFVTADSVTTAILNASEANIEYLQATLITASSVNTAYLEATAAEIEVLQSIIVTSSYVATALLQADEAQIANLQSLYITSDVVTTAILNASEANISNLQAALVTADYIDTLYLNAGSATFGELYTTVANITSLLAGTVVSGSEMTIHLTADNVVIDDAIITDAMIADLSASKITSGTIYTSYVTIQTAEDDTSLVITDGTIQISDGTYVRVQIGEDASGDYNLYLWNADGDLIWNAQGLTAEGLGGNGAIIKDLNVADDAAISGYKLDISSVASALTEDGSLVVDAANVLIDSTTLSAAYTTIIQSLDGYESALSDLGANSVANIVTYYAIGDSDTESPGDPAAQHTAAYTDTAVTDDSQTDLVDVISGVWTTEQLTAGEGEYLWVCYKQEMVDGSENWTTPFCITDSYVRSQTTTLSTQFEVIQGQISSLVSEETFTETINSLGEQITSVEDKYSSVVQTVEGITTTVEELAGTVSDNYTELSSKYTTIETTVSGITTTIADLSETVTGNYTELSDKYTTIEATVTGITTTVSELTETITENYTELTEQYSAISQTVDGITATVSSLTTTMDDLESDYETVSSTVASLTVNLDEISTSLSTVEVTVSDLASTAAASVTAYYAVGSSDTESPGDPAMQHTAAYTDTAVTDDTLTDLVDVISGVWYTEAPSTTEDYPYLWVAYKTVTVDGIESWSEPTCITDSYLVSSVKDIGSSITQTEEFIESKVWETYTDTAIYGEDGESGLYGEVTTLSSSYSTLTQTVSDITARVETVESTVSDNYSELTTKYSEISETVDGITSTVSALSETVTANYTELTTKYTTVSETVDGITTTIAEINESIDTLGGEYTTLEAKYTTISETVDGITTTIASISSSYDTLSEQYATIEATVDGISTTVSSLTTSVDNLESEYSTVSNTVASLTVSLDEISTSISTVEATVSDIASSAAESVVAYYAIGASDTESPGEPVDPPTAAYTDEAKTDNSWTDVVEVEASIWSTEAPSTTEDCPYLWITFRTEAVDGTVTWSEPTCISDAYLISSVSNIGSSITQTEEFIESKVWETYTETYVGTVLYGEDGEGGVYAELTGEITVLSSSYSDISQTVSDITSTVTSLQGVVSDNYSELSSQYSEISQTVDTISSTVSDLETTVTDEYSTLSAQISALTVSLDGITGTVTNIQGDIDGLDLDSGVVEVAPYFASFADDTDPSDPALCLAAACTDTAKTDESLTDVVDTNDDWSTNTPDAADGYTIWVSFRQTLKDGSYKWTTPVTYATASYVTSKIEQLANSITLSIETLQGTIAEIEITANDYTDKSIATLSESISSTYATSESVSTATADILATAESYTDSAISTLSESISATYETQEAAASILATAESYADSAVASLKLTAETSTGGTASISLTSGDTSLGNVEAVTSARTAFAAENTACTITAGTVTFNSNTFVVNSTYFGVTATGVITATSGTIGAITLTSTGIYSGGTYTYTGEDDPGDIRSTKYVGWYRPADMDDGDDTISFYAGASGVSANYIASAPFRVTYGGSVIATDFKTGGSFEVYSSSALTTLGGYMGYLTGSTGSEETIGVGVIDATGTNYLIATDAGVRMSGETADLYVSGDKIVANGAVTCKDTLTVTGATTLSSTLTVSGAATFDTSVRLANSKYIYWANSSGTYYGMIYLSGSFYVGNSNFSTYIRGSTVYVGNTSYPTYIRGSSLTLGNTSYTTAIAGSSIYINGTLLDTYITNLVGSSGSSNITLATSAPSSLDDGEICLVYV